MSPPCTPTTSFSITETVNGSHSFTIQGYSLAKGLGIGKYIASDTFTAGGYQWAIYFYPDGKNPEDNSSYVSVFIALASEGTDVRALFELTLIDQSGLGKHKVHSHFDRPLESGPFTLKNRGSMWGYKRFFRREMLESSNFLKDDCLKIDCTVGVVVSPIDCSGLHSMKVPESDIGCILMDNNDLRPTAGQGSEPPVETGCDWRTQLTPYIRERVVNKILEHLKRHLPFSGHDGLQELKKIAIRFEEKIYTAAANKNDYLRKISMKLLTMESKFQTKNPNSLPSNSSSNTNIPLDSGEVCNQGQPLSMPISANQSQGDQQMISQNNMESSGVQSCASLPPVSGVSQTCIPSVVGQNSTMPRIPQKSAWNSSGPSDMFANPQQYLYYQQQLLKQKLQQQGIFHHPFVQSQMPTCQQSGLQRPNIPLQQQIPQNVIDQQNQLLQLQLMQSQLRLQGHLSQPHMHKSSLSGGSTFQQNKMNSAVGPLQQNNVSAQSGVLISQPNIPLQSNPNILKQQLEQILHPQHLKQQQQLMKQQQQQFTQQTKQYLKQQKLLHLQLFLLLLVLLLEVWRLFSFF